MHPWADIVAGAVLLLLGRKVFWLFIAIAGFYLGVELTRALLVSQPNWLIWLVAIGVGVVGAVIAMLFQRVAFALGGFYAGGYLALIVAEHFAPGSMSAGAFLIGGVVGAVIAFLIMDWAVVVLSCMVGAALIVASLRLGDLAGTLVYAGLVAIGIAVQAQLMSGAKPGRPAAPG